MLAPFLAAFTVFVVVPVLFSFVLSFTQFNMVQRPSWVGFENYLRMFLDDRIFLIALQETRWSTRRSPARSATCSPSCLPG